MSTLQDAIYDQITKEVKIITRYAYEEDRFGYVDGELDICDDINDDEIFSSGDERLEKTKPKEEEQKNIVLERIVVLWGLLLKSPTVKVVASFFDSYEKYEISDENSKSTLVITEYQNKLMFEYSGLLEVQKITSINPFKEMLDLTFQLSREYGINNLEEDINSR